MFFMNVNFLFTVVCLSALLVAAQHVAHAAGSGQGRDFTSKAVISSPEILQRLLEHPQVREVYDQCKKDEPCAAAAASTTTPNSTQLMARDCQETLTTCIWGKLPQTTRDQILDALNSLQGGSGRANSEYEKLDMGTVTIQSDRAFMQMRDFFKGQMEEALYGDVQGASNNSVDQVVFLKIYETRVSKNLVEAITAFCIDVPPFPPGHVYKMGSSSGSGSGTADANRKAHADLLGSGSSAGQAWKQCASDIRNICTYLSPGGTTCPNQKTLDEVRPTGPGTTPSSSPPSTPLGPAPACAAAGDDERTRTEACKVDAAMKTARAALLMADELKTAFGSAFQGGQGLRDEGGGGKVYTGGGVSGEKTIDQAATLTSKNIQDNYVAGASAEATKVAQACGAPAVGASGQGNTPDFNPANCQHYVMTQEMAQQAESNLSEYALRSKAMQERMKSKLTNDPSGAELTKYLQETGMSESEIQAIKSDNAQREKVIASIIGSYEAQRVKIIRDMQERIAKKSASSATFDETNVRAAADNIQQELVSEPERYKRVTHYSNLITVFLQQSGAGITFTGASSAESELTNSALDSTTNTTIRNNLATQGLGGGNTSGSTAQQSLIRGQDLNKLLIDLKQ